MLDGEGGYRSMANWCSPRALGENALPLGLAPRIKLKNDIEAGSVVKWSDVEIDHEVQAVKSAARPRRRNNRGY